MRRPSTEVLRRGFNNALANWQLILIRIGESIALLAFVVGAAIAAIVPLVISIGLSRSTWSNPVDSADAILDALATHWMVFVYIFAVITFVLLIVAAVHSFVSAGAATVYVDGERRTSAIAVANRDDFRAFTGERWWRGGADGWWTVFWIYNLAWGVAGLIMIAPLVVVVIAMAALRGAGAPAVIATGCVGTLISGMFLVAVAIVANIWCEKAVIDCMAHHLGAGAALSRAWREFRTDTGRHIAVAVVLMAIAFAGAMFLSSFSWIGSINHSPGFSFALMPLQFSASIAQSIFSAAVGAWFLASFAGLAVDSRP